MDDDINILAVFNKTIYLNYFLQKQYIRKVSNTFGKYKYHSRVFGERRLFDKSTFLDKQEIK